MSLRNINYSYKCTCISGLFVDGFLENPFIILTFLTLKIPGRIACWYLQTISNFTKSGTISQTCVFAFDEIYMLAKMQACNLQIMFAYTFAVEARPVCISASANKWEYDPYPFIFDSCYKYRIYFVTLCSSCRCRLEFLR